MLTRTPLPMKHALILGLILFGIGFSVGEQVRTDDHILGCDDLGKDTDRILDQRLAEKKRIDEGKPVAKSWINLPDPRRNLDIQHMRALGCENVPTAVPVRP